MPRKDAILNMRKELITRRDALRRALAGDLSLLKELRQQSVGEDGIVTLDGEQATETTATHALRDGAVQSVQARTSGRFTITLAPPAGSAGPTLQGHLDVDVTSTTRRQG